MRTSRFPVVLTAATVLILGLITGVLAQGHDLILDRDVAEQMMDQIGVTSPQRDVLRTLHADFVRESMQLKAQKETARKLLASAVHDEVFNEQAIRRAATELSAVEAEELVVQARMVQEVRRVLTPEQYEELQEAHSRMIDAEADHNDGRGLGSALHRMFTKIHGH